MSLPIKEIESQRKVIKMALILGRRPGESVYIIDNQGREIKIEVIKGKGNFEKQLKLLIDAPDEFRVVRGEIYHDNNS